MFQQFLYTSEGKTVTTYLNLIDVIIKPVALYVCKSGDTSKTKMT